MKFNKLILIATSLLLLFVACHHDHDDPNPTNNIVVKDTVYISGSQNMDGAYVVDTVIVKYTDMPTPVLYFNKNNKFFILPIVPIYKYPTYSPFDTITYNTSYPDTTLFFSMSMYVLEPSNQFYNNLGKSYQEIRSYCIPEQFFRLKSIFTTNGDSLHFDNNKLIGSVKFEGKYSLVQNGVIKTVIDSNITIRSTKIKLNHEIQ